jgi:GMP synthase (glutamine-hydrolysing)
MQHDTIAVIDFGGQYAHLIATKVRRLGVLAEIRQPEDPVEAFHGYKGIIISGSPALSSQGEDQDYTKGIYDLDLPIVGFCFGHQEIAKHYGGEVVHGGREWGQADLQIQGEPSLFSGLGPSERVWMSHYDSVTSVGPEFEELGYTVTAGGEHRYAAIGSETLKRYGLQFHPEVDDTVHGTEMISNFVFKICGCTASWSMERYLEEQVERIRGQVGDESVFLLASGGVDSTVAAVVIGEALGSDRLHLLHIDNGLMRKDESPRVLERFRRMGFGENLHFVDASETFLDALAGLVEPEEKRRAIGDAFVRVFQETARDLRIEDHLLGQGTIYPDTIETGGTQRADVIKTHHNRVPIIEKMIEEGKVVEPLADLYKVEVRELGERMEISDELLWRHPFPGPGLGVRLLCNSGEADRTGFDVAEPLLSEVSLRFGMEALLLPIRSVGVKADLRAYEHPVLLSGSAPWDTLIQVASAVTGEIPGINRCIWNLAPDTPSFATPLAASVTRERLDLLREADHIVMEALRRHNLYDDIWQCPTVLVPLQLGGLEGELIVLRPVISERAMTARPYPLPDPVLNDLRREILGLSGVSGLALDITSKPPGTIEWE